MQISDVTQHQRRVRVLFDANDVKAALVAAVAGEAGVDLEGDSCRVDLIEFTESPGGGPQAEVILVIDNPGAPKCGN